MQNITEIPWLGPPPLEVWSAQFQGKVEIKYMNVFIYKGTFGNKDFENKN